MYLLKTDFSRFRLRKWDFGVNLVHEVGEAMLMQRALEWAREDACGDEEKALTLAKKYMEFLFSRRKDEPQTDEIERPANVVDLLPRS